MFHATCISIGQSMRVATAKRLETCFRSSKKLHSVGFEPTHTNIFELESNPLDRSGMNAKETYPCTVALQQNLSHYISSYHVQKPYSQISYRNTHAYWSPNILKNDLDLTWNHQSTKFILFSWCLLCQSHICLETMLKGFVYQWKVLQLLNQLLLEGWVKSKWYFFFFDVPCCLDRLCTK